MPLRYEGIAQVGDTIRSYDFPPAIDHERHHVIGEIVAIHFPPDGPAAFEIECTWDTLGAPGHTRVGQRVFVPLEILGMDYEGRIERLG